MPKKAKQEFEDIPFIDGLNPSHIVVKSRPLFSLWRNGLTLKQFKIIDTYLSRINTRNISRRTVVFKAGDFEKLCGCTTMRKDELIKTIQSLQLPVLIEDNGEVKSIVLFSYAECKSERGQWRVKLSASPEAMTYIFNAEQLGYFRYKLRNVVNISRLHSYLLFTYLESRRNNHTTGITEWTADVDELKKILGCYDLPTYQNEFKFFNSQILQKCHEELTEKTEIRFDYEPERSGKYVTGVHFTLQPLKAAEIATDTGADKPQGTETDETDPSQLAFEEVPPVTPEPPQRQPQTEQEQAEEQKATPDPQPQSEQDNEQVKEKQRYKYSNRFLEDLAEAADSEFDERQMKIINLCMPKFDNLATPEREKAKFEYLFKMYLSLNEQAEKNAKNGKPIKDRFKYLKSMIEQDMKQEK